MNKIISYLKIASEIASKGQDFRSFFVGAVAVRNDGAIVYSYNGPTRHPSRQAHAEYRISRKTDVGSIVYVARIRLDGDLAMAKPCKNCKKILSSKGVKRVYYTIDNKNYGFMDLQK